MHNLKHNKVLHERNVFLHVETLPLPYAAAGQRLKIEPVGDEFYDFYRTPRGEVTPAGASSQTTTRPTLTSNVKFMNFYPFNDIETISPRPLLLITGADAHSREFSEDAYQRAAEPKQLLVIPNAGHVDLYDRVELIPFDTLTTFFQSHLQ